MRKLTFGFSLAVFLTFGTLAAAAYGGFYNPLADGTVVPVPATAYLTCYEVDSSFQLVSANTTRSDILATFVQRVHSQAGNPTADHKVCFLRPASVNGGDWTPPIQIEAPPTQPNSCPGNFVPGINGGCVPPDHPLAVR